MNLRRGLHRLLREVIRQLASDECGFSPPSSRRLRAFGTALEVGFRCSLALSALLLIGVAAVQTTSRWVTYGKLALAAVLLVEGTLLATNAWEARRLLLWRLTRKSAGRVSIRRRIMWWAAPPAVSLLGLAWLAVGLATGAFALQTIL